MRSLIGFCGPISEPQIAKAQKIFAAIFSKVTKMFYFLPFYCYCFQYLRVESMLQRSVSDLDQLAYFDRLARASKGFVQVPEGALLYSGFNQIIPKLTQVDNLYVSSKDIAYEVEHDFYRGQLRLRTRYGFSAILMSPKGGEFNQRFGSGPEGRPHAYFLSALTEWADERGVDAIEFRKGHAIIFDPSAVLELLEVQEFMPVALEHAV